MAEFKFKIGDIVKWKYSTETEYYIVTDYDDWGVDNMYEIMKIYPIREKSHVNYEPEGNLKMVAEKDGQQNKMMIQFIIEERNKKGYSGEPDFLKAIESNRKIRENVKEKRNNPDEILRKAGLKSDVIRYDKLGSVDECLDAMNDLKLLHETFGDEAYLQLRELVVNRLKELVLSSVDIGGDEIIG